MHFFKSVDKWIARKCYPYQVRIEARAYFKMGFVPVVITKQIYDKHIRDWRRYGIKFEDIQKVVEDVCEIKMLKGIWLKIGLRNARATIKERIKQKKIIFISENLVKYKDKRGYDLQLTFDELAGKFIDTVKMGFQKEDIVKIIKEEYYKGVKK